MRSNIILVNDQSATLVLFFPGKVLMRESNDVKGLSPDGHNLANHSELKLNIRMKKSFNFNLLFRTLKVHTLRDHIIYIYRAYHKRLPDKLTVTTFVLFLFPRISD